MRPEVFEVGVMPFERVLCLSWGLCYVTNFCFLLRLLCLTMLFVRLRSGMELERVRR